MASRHCFEMELGVSSDKELAYAGFVFEAKHQ